MKTPVYCGEGGKTSPFCPTLVPTVVASSLQGKLEKAALRRFMCPQLFCVLWTVEIAEVAGDLGTILYDYGTCGHDLTLKIGT